MRFNSLIFVVFLGLVVAGVWSLPERFRKRWLILTSLAFYASWHAPYLLLLVSVVVLNHLGARWVVDAASRKQRGGILVSANLLLLAVFKYLGWLSSSASSLLQLAGLDVRLPMPSWVLPLGLSFFLFECVSYVVDLTRKREKLHPFEDLLLFIAFFPKLIAGPILRAKELLPQVNPMERPKTEQVTRALWLIISGIFLKVFIADGLGPGVDAAFARDTRTLGTFDAWAMVVGFGLQIYFDFSSYSRIAQGAARLCGVELVDNFNHPFIARSPADFWARWHMSLSRWIRDYVFFPMVGGRATLAAMAQAAIGSMVLCGIWHGAGWTYVAWGLWHGLMVAGYHVLTFRGRRRAASTPVRWPAVALGWAVTFGLVMLGWAFFRASSLVNALSLVRLALMPVHHLHRALPGVFYLQVAVVCAAVWAAPFVSRALDKPQNAERSMLYAIGRGVGWAILLAVSAVYLRGQSAFIYFQF